MVIVPGLGLLPPDTVLCHEQLQAISDIPIDTGNENYTAPFLRDAKLLNERAGSNCQYVLLGSIATDKYTQTLLHVFGKRLLFPVEFVGRGDMSRGGLMLRRTQTAEELSYIAVEGAIRRGRRPSKLAPLAP